MTAPVAVLAGTAEARALVSALASTGHAVCASLAGATRAPAPLGVPTRTGGFGGVQGFADWLHETGARAVIDATHPFAARIGPRSAAVCAEAGVPFLRLLRPAWTPGQRDDWRAIDSPSDAAALIPKGAGVFLALGRQRLADWAPLAGRRVIARQVDPPEGPPPFAGLTRIAAAPGKDATAEAVFLRAHQIGWIVARNSGGPARAKLDAARALFLPVLLLPRPPPPQGVPVVATVEAACAWVQTL